MRIRTLLFGTAAAAAGAAAAYVYAVRPWWRSWSGPGRIRNGASPGDDLIPDANVVDTRAVDIDASPDAVWPWLVQMGYGRAGWYSYDAHSTCQGREPRPDRSPSLQGLAA